MSSRHPWYDAFAAASMSCFWMGAWPPAMWLPHVYSEHNTDNRYPDNSESRTKTRSFPARLMRHGRAQGVADRSQGVNDAGLMGTSGRARART